MPWRMKTQLKVAAVQMKFRRTPAENALVIAGHIGDFARSGGDAVLFPETAITGYNIDFRDLDPKAVESALAVVARAACEHACNVLVGSPTRSRGCWFNSLLVFDRRGREVFRYHKIHLTPGDAAVFKPGNALAFFRLDGVPCTAIICHERRYPELVRLPVMMGAQIVFHPNAGLDTLAVSRSKRGGRDGIVTRAFENQIFYVFANTVGPQGGDRWSAGDSKIVSPDMRVLALANNRDEMRIESVLDLAQAGRKYACEAQQQPAFLRRHWQTMLAACCEQLRRAGVPARAKRAPRTSSGGPTRKSSGQRSRQRPSNQPHDQQQPR
jgi:predicted amidohydrolase